MFKVSTVIVLLMTVVVMLLPKIIDMVSSEQVDISVYEGSTLYVVDNADIFRGDASIMEEAFSGIEVFFQTTADIDSIKKQVLDEEKTYLLVITETDGIPVCEYSVNESGTGPSPSGIATVLQHVNAINSLTDYSVPPAVVTEVLSPVNVIVDQQGKSLMQGMIGSIVVTLLLYFAIYMYGYGVSMSVAAEKTSRVMEILITSTKPSSIIIGKTAAMGALGLLQLFMTVAVGGITYALAFPKDLKIMGENFDLSVFSPFAITMLFVYFILGYALYAMLSAVAGATVSKAEDVNSAVLPVSMLSMMSFFLAYYPSLFPGGVKILEVVSQIPFVAPFAMPSRLMLSYVPAWQIALSLSLLIASIVFFAWVSIKLYSSAVLHYGKRLQLKDLLHMARKK